MPQAAIAAALGISVGVVTALIQTILINIALGALSRKLAKHQDNGPPPLNVTVKGTVEPRRIVLGRRRVGGVLAFYGTSSVTPGAANKEYLWYVIVIAGHQISDITDHWLDTERIADSNINGTTGEVTGGKFSGKAYIWRHLGTGAQTVDTTLDAALTDWTSDHRLRGCAYIVVRLQRDDSVFNGAPQSVTSLVDGALVYDQRKDSTNGGSGTHRAENPSTWEFSRNPFLLLQWYLTGGSVINDDTTRTIRYGLREPYSRVESAYIVAAANVCDETLSGANAPPSGSQTRYYCDGEFTCAQHRRDIINSILATSAGTAVMVHGKWRVYAGAYETPIHTINQDELHGDLQVQDTSTHNERYNQVSATFIDAAKQYAEDTTPFRTDSAYETQDGGEPIPKEPDLRCVTDQYQAQRLCEIDLRKSRMQRTVKLVGSLNLLKIAPYEGISYTHAKFGWSNRIIRPAERQFEYMEDAGRLSLTCVRDDPGVWAEMVTADYVTGTSTTDVFTSDGPDSPTSMSIASFPTMMRFTIGLPSYMAAGSVVELFEYTSSTPFSSATKIGESRNSVIEVLRRDVTSRFYWVRVRDQHGAVSGTFPASTGQSGAADYVQTTDIATGAVLATYSTSVAGPLSVVDNTGPAYTTFTNVAQLAVSSFAVDTVQVVTVNGHGDMTNNGATLTSHQVTMYDNTLTTFIPNQFVLANQVVSQGTLRGPFSFEMLEAVPAGTSRTWNIDARVVGDAAGTITGNVSGITFKVEVHKRT